MSINQKIKELRKSAGLSQQEVADKLGLARATYSGLELGKREPDLGELRALAQFYEIPMIELVAEEGDDWPGVVSEPTPTYGLHPDESEQPYEPEFDPRKFAEALLSITSRVGAQASVGESTLYKLLYFIDFDYYESYDAPLTGLTYIRTEHGPVPTKSFDEHVAQMIAAGEIEIVSTTYHKNKQRKYLPVVAPTYCALSARDIVHIDRELTWRGDTPAPELLEFIRRDPPWRIARDGDILPYQATAYRKSPRGTATPNSK